MKTNPKHLLAVILAVFLLAGCSSAGDIFQETEEAPISETQIQAETQPVETEPPATIPADGNPEDVTCKGSYTGTGKAADPVAQIGDTVLRNGELQSWYWAAVATYREAGHETAPDFSKPLDTQVCPIDESVNSWQQYFLKQALSNWHTSQALDLASDGFSYPLENNYARLEKYWETNMVDIPAMRLLYGYATDYQMNSLHQAYLDGIPELLTSLAQELGYADSQELARKGFGCNSVFLREMVELYNRGYMYHTTLSYYNEATDEEVEAWFAQNEEAYAQEGITRDSGNYVTFRHILLVPNGATVAADGTVTCDDEQWEQCHRSATWLVYSKWGGSGRPWSEGVFSDLAHSESADTGTAADGGAYRNIKQGQMIEEIDQWCFDSSRKKGDYTVLQTKYGVHILYFSSSTPIWKEESKADLLAHKQQEAIRSVTDQFPMTVEYGNITLTEAEGGASLDRLLYADVAHERYPEIPLYLQQDFGSTYYGAYPLRTHGCGLTAISMLSTYMMDEEWTPVEMCRMYGRYSTEGGSDTTLFIYEPPALGYYTNALTYKPAEAYEALQQGHIIVSVQTAGYWTSGGHFIVVEKLNEDGTVQVRDSNLFNYGKLEGHKEDKHTWKSVTTNSRVMWIVEKKLTTVEACSRCGDCKGVTEELLNTDYLCHKCQTALTRREAYLTYAQ